MIHSFLLIGQSNMAGRGFLDEVKPIRDSRILMLRNGRWQTMSEPIHFDRPFAGIGMGASFAMAWLKDHPNDSIGLIPCADGGSALDQWAEGSALFDHAVYHVELAKRISVFDGILWHQGENDCVEELIRTYPERFEAFILALRKETESPDLPFMIGGLGDYLVNCTLYNDFKKAPMMNDMFATFAKTHENTYYVSAAGLLSNPDVLHFNAVSQRKFGLRYYSAFKNLSHIEGPVPGEDEIDSICSDYVALSMEEKIELVKKDYEAGIITYQEFVMRKESLSYT